MYAFQTFVGLGVECIVTRAVVPAVIIVVRVVAHVRGAVICVLVFEVEGKYIFDGSGCAEVDAPRRTQFVVNGNYVLLVLSVSRCRPVVIPRRRHLQIIALREVVERRRAYRKADAEGVVLDGAHDKAKLHVYAVARELFLAVHQVRADIYAITVIVADNIFSIHHAALQAYVVATYGQAGIKAVLEVEGDIKVKFMYAAPLRPAVIVAAGLAGQVVHAFAVGAFLGINQVALIAGITQRANVITLLRQPALVAAVV